MRNETTTPKGTENRVKVFISSRCEPKENYGTFRRALKKLLTETNLCSVFIFEDGASTQTAEEYYQSQIPQSDVVIFFVDNDYEKKQSSKKKSSPDGVLQEYQETKTQRKKHFFFYCGNDKNKTEFQKEIERNASAPKWLKIDDFTKAADEIYDSVINDILLIYKNYCGGWLTSSENIPKDETKPIGEANAVVEAFGSLIVETATSETAKDVVSASGNTSFLEIDFNLFSQTYAVLAKALRHETPVDFKNDHHEPMKTSDLDTAVAPLFAYIIGHGSKDAIDWVVLKTQVTALHSGAMAEFVDKRIGVIEKYVNGAAFDDLRSSINGIYDFAKMHHLQGWLLFDVLIDNRNINAMTAERTWHEDLETTERIQEQLKEIKEKYYPAIDRLESDIDNKCLNEQFKQKTKSIGTITFGESLWGMYDLIKIFILALSNGSLFHVFYSTTRLERLLYSYMLKFTNRELYIEYVRAKLISANGLKELEATIREHLGNDFNALEANTIWNSICNLPEYHRRNIVKYKAVKLLWDYYDDETFAQVSQWLLEKRDNTISDIKNKSFKRHGEDDDLFEVIAAIASRLTKGQLYSIITNAPINVWNRPSAKWLFKIWLHIMDSESYDSDDLAKFFEILVDIHNINAVQHHRSDFLNMAIRVVLSYHNKIETEKYIDFKKFLEESYPEVINDYASPDLDARLTLRLEIIEKRGQEKGGSSGDIAPFEEILRIISAKLYSEMPDAIGKRMYSAAVSTIYSENKYIADNERLTALKILMVLVGRFKYDQEQLHQDITHLPQTYGGDWPFSISTPKAIVAGVHLLRATLGAIRPAELLLLFPDIQDDPNVHATIDVIRYWVRFCGKITKPAYIEATLQYAISQLLGNDRSAIRRIASLMLVELSRTKYDKLALDMISQIIDAGATGTGAEDGVGVSFADKTAKEVIISALQQFKRKNPKQVRFILAKAQTDTSWSVRNAAKIVEGQYLH